MNDLSLRLDSAERHALHNGLRLVIQPDRRLPLVALELCIEAGSAEDPHHLAGLAHLCEHLAFQGTTEDSVPLPELIQARGGTTNATTFHGRTCFRDLIPSGELPAALWAAAQRLAVHEIPLDDQAFDTQRRVLLAEHRQQSENQRLLAQLQTLLYEADHPYHRPPGGSPEGLQRITREDAKSFLSTQYGPERAILVLAGDLSTDEALRQIEETLGAIPRGTVPGRGPMPLEPSEPWEPSLPEIEQRRGIASPAPTVRTSLASRAPGYGHRLWYAADLAAHALTDRTSPLHRALIDDQGLAHAIRVSLLSMRRASTVAITVQAAAGVERQRIEDALLDSAGRLLRQGLGEAALSRAKKAAVKSHLFKMQTLDYRASLGARLTSYFEAPERLAEELHRYRQVDIEDLRTLGETLFQTGNRVLVSWTPGKGASS